MSFWQLPVQPGTKKNASKRKFFGFCLSLDRTREYWIFISTATVTEILLKWLTCTIEPWRHSSMHAWWRHQDGNIFRVTGPLCGEFTGPGEFPTQRPVTRSFDVFFDLRLNKRLSKQPWGWWFETLSWSLWRHCNAHECNPRYAYIPRSCSVKLTDWIKLRKQGYFNRPNNRCIVLPPIKFQSEISVTLGELGGRSA